MNTNYATEPTFSEKCHYLKKALYHLQRLKEQRKAL